MEKRALVLAAGGEKGAYHAGAMQVLLESMENPGWDIIAGTSVGAVTAFYVAQFMRSEAEDAVKSVQDLWLDIKTKDIYKRWCPFGKAHGLWKAAMYDSRPLRKTLGKKVDLDKVAASDVDLRIGTVDRDTGAYEVFGKDSTDLLDAVVGSASIPVLFLPSNVNGSWKVDGGLRNASPIKAAIKAGATHVDLIMLHPSDSTMTKMDDPNAFDMISRTIDVLLAEVIDDDLRLALKNNRIATLEEMLREHEGGTLDGSGKRAIEFRVVRPEKPLPTTSLEFNADIAAKLIAMGREDARRQLG